MRTTDNYGFPVAEPDDARRDFPTQVDGPRTDGIDTALQAIQDQLDAALAKLPSAMASGTLTNPSITTPQTYPITFPAGRFTAPPRVFCQPFEKQYAETSVENITAAGCDITVTSASGAGGGSLIVRIYWLAVQA